MFKRIICFLLALFILSNFFSISNATSAKEQEALLKTESGYNRQIYLPKRGATYYFAQNSPEWKKVILNFIENDKRLSFGDAGCVITSCAIAVANLVEKENIHKILDYMPRPFRLDSIALNEKYGLKKEYRFLVNNNEDLFRFFPLAVGQYATGNNNSSVNTTKNSALITKVLEIYGINYEFTSDFNLVINALNRGALVITSSGGFASPISNAGHYFLLATHNNGYLYALDPYVRESFKKDNKKIIEILDKGLWRVKDTDIDKLVLNKMIIVYPKDKS